MSTFRALILFISFCFASSFNSVHAFDTQSNHTGFYLYGSGGIWKLSHDTNVRTNLKFGGDYQGAYAFTFGYNFTDWFALELQSQYATTKDDTASGPAREHAATVRLNAKFNFFTAQAREDKSVKAYPFIKVGGVAHALYVNAPVADDKVGAYGGGAAVTAGFEVNIKALYLGIELVNDFIYLAEERRDISGTDTLIVKGGFDYQLTVLASIGVHF